MIVAKTEAFSYKKQSWYQVRIHIEDDSLKIYFNKKTMFRQLVMETKINPSMHGNVGLFTYMTDAAFAEIILYPLNDP